MYVIVTYFYLLVCLLILLFTVAFIFIQKYNNHRELKAKVEYIQMIGKQNEIIELNGAMERSHIDYLFKRLKHSSQLIAYHKALEQLKQEDVDMIPYLIQIEPLVEKLVHVYRKHDKTEQAYLAWFIAAHAKDVWDNPSIYRNLIFYLEGATVYLSENILRAIYQQPDVSLITKAFVELESDQLSHHAKVIQDGLLSHPYDHEVLAKELWQHHQYFRESVVIGIVGFITLRSENFQETFFDILQKEQINLEIKTSMMRYFRRHPYSKMEQVLISYASDYEDVIRIVAVDVLSEYPSKEVIRTLRESLKDENWYVRRNASLSLVKLNVSKEDILDVLTGHDRYAKEMVRYHLNIEEEVSV